MQCELLAEQNLSMMLDFVDDENTKYDEAVLKTFLGNTDLISIPSSNSTPYVV